MYSQNAPTIAGSLTRLNSPRFILLFRLIWTALFTLFIVVSISALSASYKEDLPQYVLQASDQFAQFGISMSFVSAYYTLLLFVVVWGEALLSALVMVRKSDDWLAVIFAFSLMTHSLMWHPQMQHLQSINTLWRIFYFVLSISEYNIYFLLLALFPNGRLYPRWIRWLSVLHLIASVRVNALPAPSGSDFVSVQIIYIILLAAQIARYRKASELLQKQQILWFLLGVGISFIGLVINDILISVMVPRGGLLLVAYTLVIDPILTSGLVILSLVILVISILRYRLWRIDIVINRSLVYAVLSAVLAAVFLFVLFAVQPLLVAIFGSQQTSIAAVISTLCTVGMYRPVRNRIQRFVDQRFFGLRGDVWDVPRIPRSVTTIMPPPMIGDYVLEEIIGRGALADVYRAKHSSTGHVVALKLLLYSRFNEYESKQRFEREATLAKTFEHPNLVRIFEYGVQNNTPYIAMELIEGESLSEFLKRQPNISLEIILTILCDVARALDYIHDHNMVHRDVKPANILLKWFENGTKVQALLADFGLIKSLDMSKELTLGGLGTLEYMAPEQFYEAQNVGKTVDIYSLGIIAFQMFGRKLPFTSDYWPNLMMIHVHQPVPDLQQLHPGLPDHIVQAINKALAKKAEDRFARATDFVGTMQLRMS